MKKAKISQNPIAKKDIIQDLKKGEKVNYHHSTRTVITCEFIEYMDFGFTAKLIALDGKKKGLEFGAFMNQVSRI